MMLGRRSRGRLTVTLEPALRPVRAAVHPRLVAVAVAVAAHDNDNAHAHVHVDVDVDVDGHVDLDGDGDGDGDGAIPRNSISTMVDGPSMLSFQRLDVYKCSIEFLAMSMRLLSSLPKGSGKLAEQLRGAALSIPLNIAEGAGRATGPDGARHYAIARGSAMECAAIIDAMRVLELVDEDNHRRAVELLERIVAMTTKLCR